MIDIIGTLQAPGLVYAPSRKFPVVSTAMRKGALVTKTRGAATLSLFTTGDGTVPCIGLTSHAVASSATAEAEIQMLGCGTILAVDVREILAGTTMTATGGGTTSIVDSSVITGVDDILKNAVLQVITCAASSALIGYQMTTSSGYTSSTGSFVTSTTMAAAMASADTYKFIKLSNIYVTGWAEPLIDGTYADAIYLDGTAAGKWCRVLGTDSTGKKLHVVLTKGYDAVSQTVCSDTY